MKKIFILLLAISQAFAHMTHTQETSDKNTSFDYGAFFNLSYRDKDLYPKGIERASGYENHGNPKELNIEHIGVYLNKKVGDFQFDLEINHHLGSNWTLNELVEKANIRYIQENYSIEAGRDYSNISFVREKNWGYGFIQMPLAIDSFFDKTLVGDGLFVSYHKDGFRLSADYSEDQYAGKNRKTIRGSYLYKNLEIISYIQSRDTTSTREDFATIKHTHTHGSGCSQLVGNEMCIENDVSIVGIGAKMNINNEYELLGEYLHYKSQGAITNNKYSILHDTKIESAYLQITSMNKLFNYGIRSEYFWHDTTLDGSGATVIASQMNLNGGNEQIDYLYTLNLNYNLTASQNLAFEIKKSNQEYAMRINYFIKF